MRSLVSTLTLLPFLACGSADVAPVASGGALTVGEAPASTSVYEVELVSNGQTLPTYAHQGRYYVLGQVGLRYGIRVTNPTAVRAEAIISVDGLDVIDGETANTQKRGYVIAPHGSITIDGFRVSNSHVAAFRFSSVDDSYAGRKGKARNVGVIGVAIFSEEAEPALVVPEPMARERRFGDDDDDDDDDNDDEMDESEDRVSANEAPSRRRASRAKRRPAPVKPSSSSLGGSRSADAESSSDYYEPPTEECCAEKTDRPGLGTEYGERRYSSVGFTRFVRASDQPTAYAELRYNNSAGLAALGIRAGSNFDSNEVTRRETAEPFPGQQFSQPPQ